MACASTDSSQAQLNPLLSDHSDVVPPDPIPNSAVKRASAHGSAAQAVRESVIAEHLQPKRPRPKARGVFFLRRAAENAIQSLSMLG